LKNTP